MGVLHVELRNFFDDHISPICLKIVVTLINEVANRVPSSIVGEWVAWQQGQSDRKVTEDRVATEGGADAIIKSAGPSDEMVNISDIPCAPIYVPKHWLRSVRRTSQSQS